MKEPQKSTISKGPCLLISCLKLPKRRSCEDPHWMKENQRLVSPIQCKVHMIGLNHQP